MQVEKLKRWRFPGIVGALTVVALAGFYWLGNPRVFACECATQEIWELKLVSVEEDGRSVGTQNYPGQSALIRSFGNTAVSFEVYEEGLAYSEHYERP